MRGRYLAGRAVARPPHWVDGPEIVSRRSAGFLVLAGLWPLLVWPNFVRVVATDERAFDDGPTAYLIVHAGLATVSMALGAATALVGLRGWRLARTSRTGSQPAGPGARQG